MCDMLLLLVCCHVLFLHINPLNAELNPICHLLALVGAHHILHVGRERVNFFLLWLVSYRPIISKLPLEVDSF